MDIWRRVVLALATVRSIESVVTGAEEYPRGKKTLYLGYRATGCSFGWWGIVGVLGDWVAGWLCDDRVVWWLSSDRVKLLGD